MLLELRLSLEDRDSLENGLMTLSTISGLAQAIRESEFKRVQELCMSYAPEQMLVELTKLQGINDFLLRLEQELNHIRRVVEESPSRSSNEMGIE